MTRLGYFISCVALVSFWFADTALAVPRVDLDASFAVTGNGRNGQYRQIEGTVPAGPIALALKRIPHYANVGGLMFETNPSYEITGTSPDGDVSISVTLEDQIADVGGLQVQTGQIAHVKGKVGSRALDLDVLERERIENAGGINVLAESWREIVARPEGSPAVTMKLVTEPDVFHQLSGTDGDAEVALKVEGYTRGSTIRVTGRAPTAMLTLALALRPFLALAR